MDTKEFLTHNPYLPIYEEMADCTYYGKPTGKLPLSKKQKKARIKNKLAKQARKKQRR